jgi:hypothetical protein
MRDRPAARELAIVRATLLELALLLLGALAIGLLVALTSLGDPLDGNGDPNTGPLLVLPFVAFWGGLTIAGTSRAALVHLISRPIPRLRVLVLRWSVLLLGLAAIALPLLWIGTQQASGGPSVAAIAALTLIASAFGAQGSSIAEREAFALAAAILLSGATVVSVQLQIGAAQLSASRLDQVLGPHLVWLSVVGFAVFAAPVAWSWSRALPLRSPRSAATTLLLSLLATLAFAAGIVRPALSWVSRPEHGELLTVVAATPDGIVVTAGSRGSDGRRDVCDGLLLIRDDGRRVTIWDRRVEAPSSVIWWVTGPDDFEEGVIEGLIAIELVDGVERVAGHEVRSVRIPMEVIGEPSSARNRATILAMGLYPSVDAVFGPDEGPWLVVLANTTVRFEGGQQARGPTFVAHGSEIQPARGHGFTVAGDRLWYVAVDGSLASVEVPWKDGAR